MFQGPVGIFLESTCIWWIFLESTCIWLFLMVNEA